MSQAGFVLHRRPYQETSLLVDFFTQSHGKVSLVAKGASRKKSDASALLQPFQPCRVEFKGRSSLKTISQLDANGQAISLSGLGLFCGLYLNELLQRLLMIDEPMPELYMSYHKAILKLSSLSQPSLSDSSAIQQPESALLPLELLIEATLRDFEFDLLNELGYGIDFETCQHMGAQLPPMPIEPEGLYVLITESGFCRVDSMHHRLPVFTGEIVIAIGARQWQKAHVLKSAKLLCRQAISPFLGDKPLQSRDTIQQFLAR